MSGIETSTKQLLSKDVNMIIRSKEDIQLALDWLNKYDTVSFDVETNSLNHRTGKLIGFGCATPVDLTGFYIIMREWNGTELVDVLTEEDVLPVIEALKNKKLLGWNFAFDASWALSKFNVDLMPSLHCEVMLAAHTCDENKPQYGLKFISAQLFGASVVGEQEDMKESIKLNGGTGTEYYKANSELMAKYGLQDNVLTCRNFLYWDSELRHQGLEKFFYEDEVMPLMKEVTFYMQYKGVPVDIAALQSAQTEINTDMQALEAQIQEQIKPLLGNFHDWYISRHYPFKFSPAFKSELIRQLGVESWPRTKSGGFSFAKVDLERAVRKSLIDPQSEAYQIATQQIKPSAELIKRVQLALLAEEGVIYPFNLLSTDHLKRLFFKSSGAMLDERALSFTDKGAPQINDEFLETMAIKYPWAALLQTYRSLSKLRGTYIDGILERSEDGIFYPQFFQHRTTSGRYSGDAQQLPRIKTEEDIPNELVRKYTNIVRNFFISGPNHKFVDADYSSLEVVVFADDAQDDALLDIIRKDYDFYSQVAIQVNNLTEYSADKNAPNFLKKHRPELRQRAKAYALGIRYGEGSYKLHKELGCSQNEAEQIIKSYYKSFPRLKARMDDLMKSAKTNGYVVSKAGRIRHLGELKEIYQKHGDILLDGLELWKEYNETPGTYQYMKKQARIYKNLVNNSLNFPIQSMAASIVSRASIAIMKEFKSKNMGAYIALSVHDELCIRCPDSEVEQVAEIMQRLMENTTKLSVPLSAEPIVGTRYGDVK
jgi:DNA polymerase I-like protein with 3'-5' exonuclease and polymerase domains